MKTFRDVVLENVPGIPHDQPSEFAVACTQALIALEIDSPMSVEEQLRALNHFLELLNDT